MFFSWSLQRQLIVLGIIIAVLAVPLSYALFTYVNQPASCFDTKRNQGEVGVDCGGPCTLVCETHVTDIIVRWSRALKVLSGVYDAVAFVENPNFQAGVRELSYTFTLYDAHNVVIAERKGTTHINPSEQFVVYEPALLTGTRVPVRTFFEFTSSPRWERVLVEDPGLFVKNNRLSEIEVRPRLQSIVVNPSLSNLEHVVITALLFDKNDNAVAVGKTEVDYLPKGSEQPITFTWPQKFEREPEVCTVPLDVMLVFDRSGSMNDDVSEPPQPLTDAQNAALEFIDTLSAKDQVGLVSFATTATFPVDQILSGDHARTKDAVSRIRITPEEEFGFTNLGDALEKATQEFLSVRQNINAKKAMIVLTDGLANAPGGIVGGETHAAVKAFEAKQGGSIIYAIGLGAGVNAEFVATAVASSEERYYPAEKGSDLSRVYGEIARVVCPDRTYPLSLYPRANLFR